MAWQIEQVELAIQTAEITTAHAASAQACCLLVVLYGSAGQFDLPGQQAEHKRLALLHLRKALPLFQSLQDRNYEITLITQIKHLKSDIPLTREAMQKAFDAGWRIENFTQLGV